VENVALRGDYVQIRRAILEPQERTAAIPEETRKTHYQTFINGFLKNERARTGDFVTIETRIGRSLEGELYSIQPEFTHSFGPQLNELLKIETRVHSRTKG